MKKLLASLMILAGVFLVSPSAQAMDGSSDLNVLGVEIDSASKTSVSLNWVPVFSKIQTNRYTPSYRIYYNPNYTPTKQSAYKTVSGSLYTSIENLDPGTLYYFGVVAVDFDGAESPEIIHFASIRTISETSSSSSYSTSEKAATAPSIELTQNYGVSLSLMREDVSKIDQINLYYTTDNRHYSESSFSSMMSGSYNTSVVCVIPINNIQWGQQTTQKISTFFGGDYDREHCPIYAFAPGTDKNHVELYFADHTILMDDTVAATLTQSNGNSTGFSNLLHVGKELPSRITLTRRTGSLHAVLPTSSISKYFIAFTRDQENLSLKDMIFERNNDRNSNVGGGLQYCYFTMNSNSRTVRDDTFDECNYALDWTSGSVTLSFNKWNPEGRTFFMGYIHSNGDYSAWSDPVYIPEGATSSTGVTTSTSEETTTRTPIDPISLTEIESTKSRFYDSGAFGSRFVDAISYVSTRKNYVQGYGDGSFGPYRTINRAEFAKILVLAARKNEFQGYQDWNGVGVRDCFTDIKAREWYGDYVCASQATGLFDGYPDGSFRPGNTINMAEAIKVVVSAYGLSPYNEYRLWDAQDVWYEPYRDYGYEIGLLNNISFIPEASLTRQQMAELIYRIEEYIHNYDVSSLLPNE